MIHHLLHFCFGEYHVYVIVPQMWYLVSAVILFALAAMCLSTGRVLLAIVAAIFGALCLYFFLRRHSRTRFGAANLKVS